MFPGHAALNRPVATSAMGVIIMRKVFTGVTVILLLAFAAAHASRIVVPWDIDIESWTIPPEVSLIIAGVITLLAIGTWVELGSATKKAHAAAAPAAVTRSLDSRAPLSFTVKQGKRYRAEIQLSWWEQAVATNEYIAGQFASVGFTDITVVGMGPERTAEGLWPLPDQTATMPSQIVAAAEITEPSEPSSASDTMTAQTGSVT